MPQTSYLHVRVSLYHAIIQLKRSSDTD